jgi:hypothetical protein
MDRAAHRESLTCWGPNAACWGAYLNRPTACAGWLTRLLNKTSGTVPAFFLFKIGWSAPGASLLVLRLGELPVFAVNLGRLFASSR